MNSGAYVEPSQMSVAKYLRMWLQDTAKHSVGGKTFERYEEIIEKHIIPALGKHPLAKLHATHIQAYYSKARISGRLNGKGGLSEKTLAQYHRILRKSLQDALRLQLINKNPADSVIAPKPKHREMNTLNTEQIAQLLTIVKEKNHYIPILLALHTGMRRGEVFGLRWKDTDLDKGTLSVRQSAEVTKSGGIQFKKPKTQKSRRMISLMPSTVEELRKLKINQKKEKISAGPAYKDSGLVCRKEDGSPMNPDVFSKSFAMMIKKTDLPRVRFHDLRHTHATQLFYLNEHPKVVSERLGHASVGITLDLYSHVLPGMQEDAALKLDKLFGDAAKKNSRT